jgi:methylaspartate mutase sigma subunit
MEGKNIVTGVIGVDVHIMGMRIIEHALRRSGFTVHSLGVQVSQEEFISAALETDAAAILISSLGGQAEIDCRGFREKCEEAGIGKVILYLGGNLMVGEHPWEEVYGYFKGMGFDRIYSQNTLPNQVIADLQEDLGRSGKQ